MSMTDKPTRRETDITVYGERRPASIVPASFPPTRRVETKLAREMEKIRGTAELGRTVVEEMSDSERYAEWTVATTMNSVDFLDRAAEQRPGGVSQAEREAREERRERFLDRMNQIADATNIKMLMTFDRATEDMNRHTVGDDVEDAQARLADFLFGRRSLPPGSR